MLLLTKECALRRNYAFFLDAGGSSLKKDLKIDPTQAKRTLENSFWCAKNGFSQPLKLPKTKN